MNNCTKVKHYNSHEKMYFSGWGLKGSLSKVLEGKDNYKDKEEFDLIIVDEAHGFRSDSSGKYDELQKICKSPCMNMGLLKSSQKKVMLLSATPLNNRPDDLQNQLLLFQNSQSCTIDGVPNLKGFFSEHILDYKRLMRERDQRDVTAEVDKIYEQIRSKVIDKVTVRRTRNNILNDPDYRADIKSQGIIFPNILPPNELEYVMDSDTSNRFYETLKQLTDGKTDENPNGKGLTYARYRAVEFLKPGYRSELTQYKSITNKNCISSKPTEYRMAGIIGGLWDFDKTIPVHIKLPADYVTALKLKYTHILEAYQFSLEKSKEIMGINPMEIIVVRNIARLINDTLSNKITTKRTLDNKIKEIEQENKQIAYISEVEPLIKKIIRVIYSNKHIAGNKLPYLIDNQYIAQEKACNVLFEYYKELKVEVSALGECLTKRDLTHLSRVNTVPDYGNADKIYSALANIRKYITYRGASLEEVSDISCAHFTMLPIIFKRHNITIPSDELHKWIDLTQKADLYGAVVTNSDIKRDDIKQTFQPFLSIKNKAQFLYGQEGFELRKREIICEYFEENYPAIFNALLSWHTITDVSIKSVANQVESDIINPICDRLIEDGLHPFRIHDAIYLPENEIQYLSFNIRDEVMSRINSEL